MVETPRYLEGPLRAELAEKMVFLGGPRQVGKTTLARDLLGAGQPSCYLNWDIRQARKRILEGSWDAGASLVVLDEVHKYRGWKSLVKGFYDGAKGKPSFLVTGSARLDLYRKGGDSLQGRYHYYRLHPFTVAEASGLEAPRYEPLTELKFRAAPRDSLEALLEFGGFPEPFLRQSARTLRRWQNERVERLFREDIRDTEAVRDLATLQLLADLLPERVGGLLSANSLREDLAVGHAVVAGWLELLERFYYLYRVYPFASQKVRSLKKEPKLFLWDWSEVPGEGPRFENLVGSHLLKFVHWLHDHDGWKTELRYLRDRDGHEVDFLVTAAGKPWFAVECKLSEEKPSPALLHFGKRIGIPYLYQVIRTKGVDRMQAGVRVISADKFTTALV